MDQVGEVRMSGAHTGFEKKNLIWCKNNASIWAQTKIEAM